MIKCPNCGLELRPDSSNPQRMKCTNCDYALDATTDDHADMPGFTYTPAALHETSFETSPTSNDFTARSTSASSEAVSPSVYDETPAFERETRLKEQAANRSQASQAASQAAQPAQATSQAMPSAQPEQAPSSSTRTAQTQAQFTQQRTSQQETVPQQATQQAAQAQAQAQGAQSQTQAVQHAAQRSAQQQFADQYWGTQGASQAAYQARQAEAAAAARMRAQQFAAYWGVPPHAGGAHFAGNQPGAALPQGMYGGVPYGSVVGYGVSSQTQATSEATAASEVASSSAPSKKSASGLAIASLVLGILALLFCWVPVVSFSGLVLGIVGIVLGTVALARINRTTTEGKSLATAGSICSAIALILALLVSIVSVFLVNAVVKDSDLYDSVVRNFITVRADVPSTPALPDAYATYFDVDRL